MPFNGSGGFVRLHNWTNEAAVSTPILPGEFDEQEQDFASGFGNCITRDGQGGPTADIPWNNFGITGLRAPLLGGDAVNKTYVDTATNNRSMGGFILNFVGTPLVDTDAANRGYVLSVAFSAALPGQSTATTNKYPRSNGASAAWTAIPGNDIYMHRNLGGF